MMTPDTPQPAPRDPSETIAMLNAENEREQLRHDAEDAAAKHSEKVLKNLFFKAVADGDDYQEAVYREAKRIKQAQGDQEKQERSLFVSAMDLLSRSTKVRPLIGKLIERGCLGQIFGPSGDGKSFLAIDMACSVATGTEWNGHQCQQGLVPYLAGEGFYGLGKRIKAKHLTHGEPSGLENLIVTRVAATLDDAGIRQIVEELRQAEIRTGQKVALIIVDTLARHILGDENSTRDMTEFLNAIAAIQSAFPDSTVIIVHHSGHNAEASSRSRGSSALKAALDFELQCSKGVLTFQKLKDGEIPPPIEFKLVPVEVGVDDDGEPITSCHVVYGERSAKNRDASLTNAEKELLALVTEQPGTSSGDLKQIFFENRKVRDPDVKFDSARRAYNRALDGLVSKDRIYMDGYLVMPGQGQNRDKAGTCPTGETGTNGTHPYKGVPVSHPCPDPWIPLEEDLDDVAVEVSR